MVSSPLKGCSVFINDLMRKIAFRKTFIISTLIVMAPGMHVA